MSGGKGCSMFAKELELHRGRVWLEFMSCIAGSAYQAKKGPLSRRAYIGLFRVGTCHRRSL